jgi:glycerophosphoryl diester phosphodiesterase
MQTPSWPGPRRIAHRGGGRLAPENTIAAIRAGIAHGYRAVEFDVMLTADDVPVLMHDPDFGRTIAGSGSVATTTWDDLSRRDAGTWFSPQCAGERVPRYEDVVRFCREHDMWMNVEIKPAPGFAARTGRIVGEITARLFADQGGPALPLFSSFSVEALEHARSAAAHVPRGMLFDAVPGTGIASARALGCISVHASHRTLDRAVIDGLHNAGFAVMAYTVNERQRADQLADWGVDAVCTDRIDLIAP